MKAVEVAVLPKAVELPPHHWHRQHNIGRIVVAGWLAIP